MLGSGFSAVCQAGAGGFTAVKEELSGRAIPLPEGFSQFSHQVSVGPCIHRIPVPGHWRAPVGEALVVLGGQDHISERGKGLGWDGKGTTEIFPASLQTQSLKQQGTGQPCCEQPLCHYPLDLEANIRIRQAFNAGEL